MKKTRSISEDSHADGAFDARDLCRIYGTSEPPKVLRRIEKGPLSFLYSDAAIRQIEWNGVEIIRAIAWPIRDTSWGTYSPEIVDVNLVDSDDKVSGQLVQSVDDGRLVSELYFEASSDGEILAQLTLTPVSGDFTTNRAGLTILHPIRELAGAPVLVTHPDGSVEKSVFPARISPSQPLMNIAGLSYRIGSADVEIKLQGEVFEMEDQRNWSDASYKTYCVPLKQPFAYAIDHTITQTVRISVHGHKVALASKEDDRATTIGVTKAKTPAMGLVLEEGWDADASVREAVLKCGVAHIAVRFSSGSSDAFLADAVKLAQDLHAEIDAELVLEKDELNEASLRSIALRMMEVGLEPARVIALPRSYLASHQPNDPWPIGPNPDDVAQMARSVFPDVMIGGGMLSNFTELNRCPVNSKYCDFITHGSSAIVHACDDRSVVETLETLPQIFASAQYLGGGLPYRLGLVSIGMRSNPYGLSVAENPAQIREAMAREDPRHRGLFGAAWAVGVLGATEDNNVEALCLAAPTGPFGLAYARQPYTQSGYDDGVGEIYPIYHVIRSAANLAGYERIRVNGLPDGLVGYGARKGDAVVTMIANVTNKKLCVSLDEIVDFVVLDARSFDAAVSDVEWLENATRRSGNSIELDPFAVGFVNWSEVSEALAQMR